MSRAWMPWYIGDYLRDTAHLTTEQHGAYMLLLAHHWQIGRIPATDSERAAVAKLPLSRWKRISAPIMAFFEPDGTQKRAVKEMARADMVSSKRRAAGSKGGTYSAIARAKDKANASTPLKQLVQQTDKPGSSKEPISTAHNHNHKESSLKGETPIENAGSLASALRTGALASQLEPEAPPPLPHKRPNETSLEELNSILAKRRNTA